MKTNTWKESKCLYLRNTVVPSALKAVHELYLPPTLILLHILVRLSLLLPSPHPSPAELPCNSPNSLRSPTLTLKRPGFNKLPGHSRPHGRLQHCEVCWLYKGHSKGHSVLWWQCQGWWSLYEGFRATRIEANGRIRCYFLSRIICIDMLSCNDSYMRAGHAVEYIIKQAVESIPEKVF